MTSLVKIHHAITAHGHSLSLQSVMPPAPGAAQQVSRSLLLLPFHHWGNAPVSAVREPIQTDREGEKKTKLTLTVSTWTTKRGCPLSVGQR